MEFLNHILSLFSGLGATGELAIIGIVIGSLLIVYGFFGGLIAQNPVGRRYHTGKPSNRRSAFEAGLLNNADVDPKGFMKALMPQNREKRTRIRRQLMNAGMVGQNAIAKYYALRVVLAIALPGIFLLFLILHQATLIPLPGNLGNWFEGPQGTLLTYYLLTCLLLVGFFAPSLWLRSKVDERQLEVSETFPNALDLMVVAVEAGLGFDAAMTRVSNEMEETAPAIAQEFRLVQLEVAAVQQHALRGVERADGYGKPNQCRRGGVFRQCDPAIDPVWHKRVRCVDHVFRRNADFARTEGSRDGQQAAGQNVGRDGVFDAAGLVSVDPWTHCDSLDHHLQLDDPDLGSICAFLATILYFQAILGTYWQQFHICDIFQDLTPQPNLTKYALFW
jgi:tight adherence protein C